MLKIKVAQSYLTLHNLMDYTVYGILQARILEWVALQCSRLQFNSWVRKICWSRDNLTTPVFMGFPGGSTGTEYICNMGDLGLIPGLGRSPEEGSGNPLQYACLENPIDGGAW